MPTYSMTELAEWSGGTWTRPVAGTVDSVSNDTRTLRPGALYVALKGPAFDGHDFVAEAFRKGASGAVVGHRWLREDEAGRKAASAGGPLLGVEDTGRALGALARGYAARIGAEMIVVTGSAGKSTVKDMTAGMLGTAFATARTQGNWNNEVGLPLSLLKMERSTRMGVFELGINHPGEMARLCELLSPTWAVITNIGPVHIEYFGSLEAIAREKGCTLRNLPADGGAVLNQDGSCFELLKSLCPARVVSVSMSGEADYRCVQRNAATNEAVVLERATGESARFRLTVPGEHSVMNAMMALAVARAHGVGWAGIRTALEGYAPLPMRWEVTELAGIRIVNDAYNANPMSMRMAIRTFAETGGPGPRWLLLGGMLELGAIEQEEHFRLGQFVGGGDWAGLIVVGKLGGAIGDGAQDAGFRRDGIVRCETAADAVRALRANLREGDAVLLKASRGIHLEDVLKRWKEEVARSRGAGAA